MTELNIEKLLSALEDDDNAQLLELDFKKIEIEKKDILDKLGLPNKQQNDILKKQNNTDILMNYQA